MGNNLFRNVRKNKFGYFELKHKPNPKELEQYYIDKYYEQSRGNYRQSYSKDEIIFFKNKLDDKYLTIKELLGPMRREKFSFLDIGCGEGWALDYFRKKGFAVTGLDYSSSGTKTHNKRCLPFIRKGDIYEQIPSLIKEKQKFDVIFMEHTLEHVLNPFQLLGDCKKLLHNQGVIVVVVPNDFSILQLYLYKHGYVKSPFWIVIPDHISYFNKTGLEALVQAAGLRPERFTADFPVDINLLNKDTNYVIDKAKGKSCHQARVELENLVHKTSPKKVNKFYEALADMGLGRNLICFATHSRKV